MKERIRYIDSLKGLAILLMVMGHVIAWQFPDWQVALNSEPRNTMLVWRLIYSFHMQLLMFCSGLFALKSNEYTLKAVGNTIWKRTYTLLLPFFITGTIRYLFFGEKFLDYWFLCTLFQFVFVTSVLHYVCSKSKKYGKYIITIVLCAISIVIMTSLDKFYVLEHKPLINVGNWRFFPYFSIGVICSQYNLIERVFTKNGVFTLALVVFGVMTYWITIEGNHIPKQSITGCILPISAIVASVYLFKEGFSGKSVIEKWLQNFGQHSLEIYILHFFFLFRMYPVGNFVLGQANGSGGGRTIFFVQLITSFVASIIIICLCYGVMNVINKSKILSIMLLGRKSEIQGK